MPGYDRAELIAIYVNHKKAPSLAPLVDVLCGRVGPALADARFRPVTRKVLAFDGPARGPTLLLVFAPLLAGWPSLVLLYEFASKGDLRMLAGGIAALVFTCGALVTAALAMRDRVQALRRRLARCTLVQGRVTAAVPYQDRSLRTWFNVTIEYSCAGFRHQTTASYGKWEYDLMGTAPDLLVDPHDPAQVFVRDFYV